MPDSLGSADVRRELIQLAARHTNRNRKAYESGVLRHFERAILDAPETGDDEADAAELNRRLLNVLDQSDVGDVAESIADSRIHAALASIVAAVPTGMEENDTILEGIEL